METTEHPSREFILTNSALGSLRDCERKYYLRYVAGLRSRFRSDALSMGSAFHAGIEQQSSLAAAECLRGSSELPWPEGAVDEALEERCIVVETMVKAALLTWDRWPERREVPFRLPVFSTKNYPSREYDMAGVVDGWPSEDPKSFWYDKIGEWKTTGRLSSDYIVGLQTRSQPTAYCYAASVILGRPIRTVVYRIVQRPTIKRRTKRQPESLEEYSHRLALYYAERPELIHEEWVTRTETQIQEWKAEMWEASRRAREIRRGTRFPLMNDSSCVGFGRCSYLDLCARIVTEDAYETVEDLHPEVTEAELAIRKERRNA